MSEKGVIDEMKAELDAALEKNREEFEVGRLEDLRDLFAIAALKGLLANHPHPLVDAEAFAKTAYAIADAMLKARGP